MANILFANNASTTLASPISSGALTCVLATGTGAKFPSPTGGQYFLLTFVNASTGLLTEIVKVTARSSDTCTIVRAQEGTAAQSWLAGDTAANFWTAGSVAAIQAGFPIGSGSITTNTTLSLTNAGNLYRVSGTGTVVSLPAASTVSGMAVGFSCQAAGGCTISSLGGVFAGGAPDGTSSIALAKADFVCAQSNGTVWVIFAGSPDILVGGVIALQSWVTANFDALGAASTAQANSEAYALALQGNYQTVLAETLNTTFTTANYGSVLRLLATAVASRTFTIPLPALGASFLIDNNSSFFLGVTVDGNNRFYGYVGAGPYTSTLQPTLSLPPNSVAIVVGVSPNVWFVSYNSLSWDVSGAAAAAQANAEAFATAAIAPYVVGKGVNITPTPGNGAFQRLIRLTVTVPAGGNVLAITAFVNQQFTGTPNSTIKITVGGTDFTPISFAGSVQNPVAITQAFVSLAAGTVNIDLNWSGASSAITAFASFLTVLGAN